MTFQEFHDAIKALTPAGGSFSAGMTAWTNEVGPEARRRCDWHASVHIANRMAAHVGFATTPEAAVADLREQLSPTPQDYEATVAAMAEPA